MIQDTPAKIHKAIHGCRDKANAPENDNADFKAGYEIGSKCDFLNSESTDDIRHQWERIGSPANLPDSFREWKRGYWASRLQRVWAYASALAIR